MRKLVFSLWFSLMPLFLGVCLPYVPFPRDVRVINLFWGVVYGAGLFALDWVDALHPAQPSRVVLLGLLAWPIAVSCALFMIGAKLYQTSHSGWRQWSIWILIASALAVMGLDSSMTQPPFANLPTYYKIMFVLY